MGSDRVEFPKPDSMGMLKGGGLGVAGSSRPLPNGFGGGDSVFGTGGAASISSVDMFALRWRSFEVFLQFVSVLNSGVFGLEGSGMM